jgi:hypothetical protein
MILKQAIGWEPGHWQSLVVIIGLLGTSIVASLIAAKREVEQASDKDAAHKNGA